MNHSEKKQSFSFSYIDIFFLLLAGLILSVGIGFLVETHRENLGETYLVECSATLNEEMRSALPKKGEVLYNEEGQPCGKVLSVETEEKGKGLLLKLQCRLEGARPEIGSSITVETPSCIRSMQVDAVQAEHETQEGR